MWISQRVIFGFLSYAQTSAPFYMNGQIESKQGWVIWKAKKTASKQCSILNRGSAGRIQILAWRSILRGRQLAQKIPGIGIVRAKAQRFPRLAAGAIVVAGAGEQAREHSQPKPSGHPLLF